MRSLALSVGKYAAAGNLRHDHGHDTDTLCFRNLTTAVSFLIIGISFAIIAALERRRRQHGSDAGKGMV